MYYLGQLFVSVEIKSFYLLTQNTSRFSQIYQPSGDASVICKVRIVLVLDFSSSSFVSLSSVPFEEKGVTTMLCLLFVSEDNRDKFRDFSQILTPSESEKSFSPGDVETGLMFCIAVSIPLSLLLLLLLLLVLLLSHSFS